MFGRERSAEYPGGFLCDEMGLGKTVQLLATMTLNPKPRTLVVVPKSIVSQWVSEIKRFTPHFSVSTYDGVNRTAPVFDATKQCVVVSPYSVFRDGELQKVKWDRLILDEAHEVRNNKSKTSKSVAVLSAQIKWLVTGTPVFNSVSDFVNLCGILGIGRTFVQGHLKDIRDTYVLRRTKEDLNERLKLPPCDFGNVEIKMGKEEQKLYNYVYKTAQGIVTEIFQRDTQNMFQMEILECLLRVRQVMTWPQMYFDGIAKKEKEPQEPEQWCGASAKMDTLMEMIKDHPREKALIFAQFMGEMNEIQRRLVEQGCDVYRIDGSVDKDAREHRIKAFKASTKQAVFLIQVKAGGVGLNLQEATRVYITAPSWNPATELQAIGRAHRTGQTRQVVVRKLVYEGTTEMPSVEQSIMQLQGHKAKVSAEVLNDPRLEDAVPKTKSTLNIRAVAKLFSVKM
jgi:SNF2 family DNA or RNA helicase